MGAATPSGKRKLRRRQPTLKPTAVLLCFPALENNLSAGDSSPAPVGIYATRHFLHWVWLWYMACTYEWQMWYNSLPVYSARRTELSLWTATKEKLRPSDHLGTEFCHQPQRTGMAAPSPGEPSDKTVAPVYTSPQPVIVQEADNPAHPGWTPHSQTGWVLISVHWLCHVTDTHEWANKNKLLWTVNHLSDVLPLWNTNLIHQKLLLSEEDMFISGHLRADSRKEKEHK